MRKMSAAGIEPGRLAFLVNEERGFGYFGVVEGIQKPIDDAEVGRIPGRVLMEGVKISRETVAVGAFRFKPVEAIRQPDKRVYTSHDDIPLDGWDYVCSAEPNEPRSIIDSLGQDGYVGYAAFLAGRLQH